MASIVTYDVPSKHQELKEKMLGLGYKDHIFDTSEKIYLPNTTLYHESKNAAYALKDVKTSCTALDIKLERCISTQFGPDWAEINGEPFQ